MLIEGTPEQQVELFSALAEARKSFGEVKKDADGQEGGGKYKYAPLCNLVEATAQPLANHGLVVLQPFSIDGAAGMGTLTTILQHKSGGRISDASTFPLAENIKLIGGQSTYIARYAYQRLLVLDGEDDADRASLPARGKPSPTKAQMTPEQDDRIQTLAHELALNGKDLADLCRKVTGVFPPEAGFDECAKLIAHMAAMMNEKIQQKAGVRP